MRKPSSEYLTLRREFHSMEELRYVSEVQGVRKAIAEIFIKGVGLEVGAGDRPFPLPAGIKCFYGDILDTPALAKYFGAQKVSFDGVIDAQTMQGIPLQSLDFVISAHVIEHLYDPLGSIYAAIATLKPGGIFILAAPEMTKTWDKRRPPTTLEHVILDSQDGGESTRLQAYLEHFRHVHPEITGHELPESEVIARAPISMAQKMDLHVHAWRASDFTEMIEYATLHSPFKIEAVINCYVNEITYVLRRV
jgi:SAM-dependent methyltransferase